MIRRGTNDYNKSRRPQLRTAKLGSQYDARSTVVFGFVKPLVHVYTCIEYVSLRRAIHKITSGMRVSPSTGELHT